MARRQRHPVLTVLATVSAVRVDFHGSSSGTEFYKSAITVGLELPPLPAGTCIGEVTFCVIPIAVEDEAAHNTTSRSVRDNRQPAHHPRSHREHVQSSPDSRAPVQSFLASDSILILHYGSGLGQLAGKMKRPNWISVESADGHIAFDIPLSQRETIATQTIIETALSHQDTEITNRNLVKVCCKGKDVEECLNAAKLTEDACFAYYEVINVVDNIKKKLRKLGLEGLLLGSYGPGWYFNTHPRNLQIANFPERHDDTASDP